MMKRVLFSILLLGSFALGQDTEDCLATAFAQTDSNSGTSDALANAFAGALSLAVQCDGNVPVGNPSGISAAISIALSESRIVGEECTADADAQADVTGRFLTQTLENALTDQVDGDAETLASAWLDARRDDLVAVVRDAEAASGIRAFDDKGCLNLRALGNGLATADEIGNLLQSAVANILLAVNCGTNVVETDEPCTWSTQQQKYFGQCLSRPDNRERLFTCRDKFRECKKYRSNCTKEFQSCVRGY